jgi:predicted aspartyl protease
MAFNGKRWLAGACFLSLAGAVWGQLAPDAAEQQRILRTVTAAAHSYTGHIPDFTCVRTTQHYMSAAEPKQWKLAVKVAYEMSYYKHDEHYFVVAVNDVPKKKVPMGAKADGWIESNGKFGHVLEMVFSPSVHPDFKWHGWDYVRGKRVYAFAYHVPLSESGMESSLCKNFLLVTTCKSVRFAFHGLVMVDAESLDLLRITQIPEDLPADHPDGDESVDYDRVEVAGERYLLPVGDSFETVSGKRVFRNESTYTQYRKFVANSTINTTITEAPGGPPVKPPRAVAEPPAGGEPLHGASCFAMREGMKAKLPAAYRDLIRGSIDAAFNLAGAEKELLAAAKSKGQSELGDPARAELAVLYQHAGRAREALEQLRLMGKEQQREGLLQTLAKYPPPTVAARGYSRLQLVKSDEGLTVPVIANGHASNFALDTGAALSVVSEAHAKALGMEMHDERFSLSDVNARELACRFALARELQVGSFRAQNVPFCALVGSTEEHSGVLGLPVMLMFETMRWGRDGSFEIGIAPAKPDLAQSNLCFDGGALALETEIGQRRAGFDFDTGNGETFLYAEFKDDFAELAKKAGKKRTYDVKGVGESAELEAYELPELNLAVSGFPAVLHGVMLLANGIPEHAPGCYGNAGRNILEQARRVTLDFKAMKLTLEQ